MSHLPSGSRSLSQSTQPTPREKELTSLLNKERAALKTLADAKTQLEDELESLSQALFEEVSLVIVCGQTGSNVALVFHRDFPRCQLTCSLP